MTARRQYRLLANVDHGKVRTYRKGCCCASCTAAAVDAARRWQAKARQKPFAEIPHGTAGGYTNYACRCPECTAAMTAAKRPHGRGQV
ncbi:hypothetical protein [Streptomyces violascens]|uniref:HNH endonuclease n=1 Tax=Streptomyces violascens TaxID=67381 RepID=A0ABQ3QXD7_9ACTN|nr:hypothetical protein [Streptomyces violascens]GGU12928.1 hypothetical protein GCM10010289_38190 [Streptomyces violascens]GHI41869.1 hypothetical protein Sviol_62770 [Streptomyces violascens]